jgi:hypothetical protein
MPREAMACKNKFVIIHIDKIHLQPNSWPYYRDSLIPSLPWPSPHQLSDMTSTPLNYMRFCKASQSRIPENDCKIF